MSGVVKRSTKWSVKKFTDWAKREGIELNLSTVGSTQLALLLSNFFISVRGNDGSNLSTFSCNSIHRGIVRYLKLTRPDIDFHDEAFQEANMSIRGLIRGFSDTRTGTEAEISADDIARLQIYFSNYESPRKLQDFVLFMFYYSSGAYTITELYKMTKSSFKISDGKTGSLIMSSQDAEKKKRTLKSIVSGPAALFLISQISGKKKGSVAVKIRGQQPLNPNVNFLDVYQFYLSKLHDGSPWLFQRVNTTRTFEDGVWYKHEPLGLNSIGGFMAALSRRACLLKIYSNSSIRSTYVNNTRTKK